MAEALCLPKACACSNSMHVWLFCDPMGCSSPGSAVHGIYQARILEWAAISFSRGSYWTRIWTPDSYRLVLCTNNFSWNYENGLCFKSEFWFLWLSLGRGCSEEFRGFGTRLGIWGTPPILWGFPYSSVGKESACSAGDLGSIPGLGRSPGERNGNLFQYSCLENPMDRGAWSAVVHGVAKSWAWLSN